MIPVDSRAEEFREAVASSGSFRNARGWSFFSACGAQRSNAREFIVFAQVKGTNARNLKPRMRTDKHG
jgi:hypothetical protein